MDSRHNCQNSTGNKPNLLRKLIDRATHGNIDNSMLKLCVTDFKSELWCYKPII